MLIMSLGCLQFSRESCLLYAFLLGYLPSIFCDFGEKPIDFYLQDSLVLFLTCGTTKHTDNCDRKLSPHPTIFCLKFYLLLTKTAPPSLTVPPVI